jgi:hypothetical protein
MVAAQETPRMLRNFEQRHANMMAERYWRQEAAAAMFEPEKTVRAFLDMLLVADNWPTPPVLDAESRESWRKRRFLPGELPRLGGQWKGCGRPQVLVSYGLAMARWPLQKPRCMPFLLRREGGRWRIAWEEMRRSFVQDSTGWHLVHMPRGWAFGFRGWRLIPVAGAEGLRTQVRETVKAGTPGIVPPDDEKAERRAVADVAQARQGGHMAGKLRVWN